MSRAKRIYAGAWGALCAAALSLSACGSQGMAGSDNMNMMGGMADMAAAPGVPQIKHVVLVVQENHTFDTYYGRYCSAPAGSNPTCNDGPACCERAPDTEPSGASPMALTDASNGSHDPDHTRACEDAEMNGGKMDRYVKGAAGCSDPRNWAIATGNEVKPYHMWASQYALADRYFQSISGQSAANDMYFAVAHKVFADNDEAPNAIGYGCWSAVWLGTSRKVVLYKDKKTIADLLIDAGLSFGVYAMGYDAVVNHPTLSPCPAKPSDCTSSAAVNYLPGACTYEPSDIPFEYYAQLTDNPKYMKDYAKFATDIAAGQLPSFSFLKATSYKQEHPGFDTTISKGATFVGEVVNAVLSSPYKDDTLILVTWDEGGGYFDHVPPPTNMGPADMEPYGTRVPLLAIGKFARKNYVSHVTMEHSSVVKFLEYNFLGKSGQLQTRDAFVNNIGSLLDPTTTGIVIPDR